MKTNNILYLMLALSLAVIFTACSGNRKPEAETAGEEELAPDMVELRADQIRLANIETGTVTMRELSGSLKVNGSVGVSPDNLAMVCQPLGGFVKSCNLLPGHPVSKGQVLAVLENQEFIEIQEDYLDSKSRFEYADAEFRRQSDLYKNNVSSQKTYEQVTSEYKALKARVRALEQKLRMIGIAPETLHEDDIRSTVNLTSPIAGSIRAVHVNIGKFVSPSDVLFEIVNSDKLYLELTLFEKDADKVAVGQHIRFFINNETEQHEAVIYQTGKAVDADRTYHVYATVPVACRNVLPGMYVNAIIEARADRVTALPSEAVVSFDDKDYIFVVVRDKVENGKNFTEYRMVEVQKGVTDDGFTEVRLPQGFDTARARIVVKGAYNLLSAKKNAGEMSC
ncbi:MAG TPA: efflux RND transporter periplasmic adaptor subunit [Bacteroidales bacterium]|nr:efflux RND transporter periplasmic adaptor subunit [Bacteroidales bacterium]